VRLPHAPTATDSCPGLPHTSPQCFRPRAPVYHTPVLSVSDLEPRSTTHQPVYHTPVLSVPDLEPVKRDVRGYLERADTVDECLASYGKALSKTADWREATRTAARLLRSDAVQGDTFDFEAEVGAIEQDERDVEKLFYSYAYAQVRRYCIQHSCNKR